MAGTMKKKWYQTRWGIAAIVVAVLLAIGSFAPHGTSANSANSQSSTTSAAATDATSAATASSRTTSAASVSSGTTSLSPATSQQEATAVASSSAGTLTIHYIDVGQGDSEFIQLPNGKTMLIDAGPTDSGSVVVAYLRSLGVSTIDYLVATHPHEDHIGGMSAVIGAFHIGEIWAPNASNNTRAFEKFLDAAAATGINTAEAGKTIFAEEGLSATILSPAAGASFNDLNQYSVIIELVFNGKNFLFCGDATVAQTKAVCKDHIDIWKVAHHGSDDATDAALVRQLSPSFAVISVGAGNSYGLPDESVISALANTPLFRTDQQGTIVATCDGDAISFNLPAQSSADASAATVAAAKTRSAAGDSSAAAGGAGDANDDGSATVYITNTGKKYHADGCPSLSKSKIPISLEEAKAEGYTPCSKCRPPS